MLLLSDLVADAEKYVAQESVENFRRLKNNRFVGFEVEAIHLGEDGTTAEVETDILFTLPQVPQPLSYKRMSNWRLENGEWRLYLPVVVPRNAREVYAPGKPLPKAGAAAATPPVLKFDQDRVNFGTVYTDQTPQAKFAFQNVSDQPVRIEVVTGCECLRATIEDKLYEPGDSGELRIEFVPEGYLFEYKQTVVVKTDSSGRRQLLLIEARVLPKERHPSQ